MEALCTLYRLTCPIHRPARVSSASRAMNITCRAISSFAEDPELNEMFAFMDNLKNYEKLGVPVGAGTDSKDGFDLGRMKRMMKALGNPQSKFKAVHITGTKGKGSTAAFLSGMLRAEGYSVGCYSSPHIRTVRERITLGRSGEMVTAKALNSHFRRIQRDIERAIELENGCLSHFEVFTAIAFSLFAHENMDIAVVEAGLGGARDATNVLSSSGLAASIITTIGEEHLAALGGSLESIAVAKSGIIKGGRPLVLGGPFLPHIERILREKAYSMSSPVVSASDPGNRSVLKGFSIVCGRPLQSCDIVLEIERDLHLFAELLDVQLRMLGAHQLRNATTATCAALCLRDQGWRLTDRSIRAGLEGAFLLGRIHFLTSKEAEVLGLPGATILLDGAHTKESARALAETIKMAFPHKNIILVVAMANDKDHVGFARELLSVGNLQAVFFTEVKIAGEQSRTTAASFLKDSWVRASREMGVDFASHTVEEHDPSNDKFLQYAGKPDDQTILFAEGSVDASLRAGYRILRARGAEQPGVIVATGSLHIVSAVLGLLQ